MYVALTEVGGHHTCARNARDTDTPKYFGDAACPLNFHSFLGGHIRDTWNAEERTWGQRGVIAANCTIFFWARCLSNTEASHNLEDKFS